MAKGNSKSAPKVNENQAPEVKVEETPVPETPTSSQDEKEAGTPAPTETESTQPPAPEVKVEDYKADYSEIFNANPKLKRIYVDIKGDWHQSAYKKGDGHLYAANSNRLIKTTINRP